MLRQFRLLERQLFLGLVDLLRQHNQLGRLLVDLDLYCPQLRIEGGDLALQLAFLAEQLRDLGLGRDDLTVEPLQLMLLVVDRVRDRGQQGRGQHRDGQRRVKARPPHCLRNRLTPK